MRGAPPVSVLWRARGGRGRGCGGGGPRVRWHAEAEVHEAAQATGDAEGVSAEDEKLEDAFKAMELAFKEEMGIVDEGEAPAEAAEA